MASDLLLIVDHWNVSLTYEANGDAIRKERMQAEMSRADLARLAKVAERYVSHLENGTRRHMSPKTYKRLRDAFNVTDVHLQPTPRPPRTHPHRPKGSTPVPSEKYELYHKARPPADPDQEYMDVPETAFVLRCSVSWLRRFLKDKPHLHGRNGSGGKIITNREQRAAIHAARSAGDPRAGRTMPRRRTAAATRKPALARS